MKTYLSTFIFCLIFALSACDKDGNFESNLDGNWELRHVKGGQIANISPDYSPGNGRIIKFEGSAYQRFSNGSVYSSGTFIITNDEIEIDGTKFSYKIDFDNPRDIDVYAKISGKKLIISTGSIASDGATSTYEKL